MANMVVQIFRMPDEAVDLHDAIELLYENDFIALNFVRESVTEKSYAVLISKTATSGNVCVCRYFRLPEQIPTMETYMETLGDARFLAAAFTPKDHIGNSYGFVVTRTADPMGGGAGSGGLDWQESVISQIDFTAAEPAAPTVGDRYINTATGPGSVTATQTFTANYIYHYTGSWEEYVPTEGAATRDETLDTQLVFDGTNWVNIGAGIDHTALLNIGTNTHAQIDTALAQAARGVSLTRDADNAIAGGATYVVAWESAVFEEPATFWDVGAATNLVVPADGKYLLTATVTLTDTAGAANAVVIQILVGGVAVKIVQEEIPANATNTITISTILSLTAADVVTVDVTPAGNATLEGCTGDVGATTVEMQGLN